MQIASTTEGYEKEQEKAERLLNSKIWADLKQNPHWELISYPMTYNEKLISNSFAIQEKLKNAIIYSNCSDMPYSCKNGEVSNFTNGFLSFNKDNRHYEGLVAFRSGLMLFRKVIGFFNEAEEIKPVSPNLIIHPIYLMCLFLFKYYNAILSDHKIKFELRINKSNSIYIPEHIGLDYIVSSNKKCVDNCIEVEESFLAGQSITDCRDLAKLISREMLNCFNFNPDDSFIEAFQVGIFNGKWPTD
jgi:hypothetical protein